MRAFHFCQPQLRDSILTFSITTTRFEQDVDLRTGNCTCTFRLHLDFLIPNGPLAKTAAATIHSVQFWPLCAYLTNIWSSFSGHRWQRAPSWSPGLHGREAAAERPEDCCRALRSTQHLWRVLPGKAYVYTPSVKRGQDPAE